MTTKCLQVHVLNIYTIKITLRGVSPMIWHRLRISGSTTLAQFHSVIQIAMGWDDDFLHKFRIYGKEFGIHYPGGAFYSDDPNDVRIDAFEFEPGDRFIYTYNYFDNLVHDIRVESMVHLDESHWIPVCIGGNQLIDRDSWSPPDCPFDSVDSINDLTVSELIERLTFIIEQCKPPVFCRHAVNQRLVDACRQSA